MKKLTNKIVDQRLSNRNIKRLDNYIGSTTKINFQCLIRECNHIWMTAPCGIFKGNGCPMCALNSLKLSDKVVNEKLLENNIKILDNYVNCLTVTRFLCLVGGCNYIWTTTPNSILHAENGCPQCAGKLRLTNKIVDKRLSDRSIRRIGEVNGGHNIIDFQCLLLNCNYIWAADLSAVLGGNGCPKCGGSLKLSNVEVDRRLKNRNIKRLKDVINNKTPINFQCLVATCNYIWKSDPSNILNGFKGCPNCNLGKNEKTVWQILESNNIVFKRHYPIKDIFKIENKKMIVDFYIPDKNIIIEYNGSQHYQPVCFGGIAQERAEANFKKQQERDRYLQQLCEQNNIKLIWIDGREYTNSKLEKYVLEIIIPIIKGDSQ